MVARGQGKKGLGNSYLMSTEFPFGKVKNILEMNGALHNVKVLKTTELYT